jgi:hypothetical protein
MQIVHQIAGPGHSFPLISPPFRAGREIHSAQSPVIQARPEPILRKFPRRLQ